MRCRARRVLESSSCVVSDRTMGRTVCREMAWRAVINELIIQVFGACAWDVHGIISSRVSVGGEAPPPLFVRIAPLDEFCDDSADGLN